MKLQFLLKMHYRLNQIAILFTLFLYVSHVHAQTGKTSVKFELNVDKAVQVNFKSKGRFLIYLSTKDNIDPMYQSGMDLESYVFGKNIPSWIKEKPIILDGGTSWTQTGDWDFNHVPNGTYFVQVVWDQNSDKESRSNTPGNLYSTPTKVILDGKSKNIPLTLANVIGERKVKEHPLAKTFTVQSKILSDFWKKPMTLTASVLLPAGFNKTDSTKYPVRYNVAGYGGRYTRINGLTGNAEFMTWWNSAAAPKIVTVFLDGEGPFGDSYQLNSDNSGPFGDALIKEFIPQIEKEFNITGDAKNRFVDGCSTGGWVSLALQLFYPESFNGCWSYSPDPVSFTKMQLVNVYADENAFYNKFGYLRPSKRSVEGEPEFSIKQEIYSENVQGSSNTYVTSGQQWGAWNALYSPKGTDGLPSPIFDPITGKINKPVAENWKKYDLLLHVKNNWSQLGPLIAGKINIWMGDMDNYYLNNAMRDFDGFIKKTTNPVSDAVIEFTPTKGHCTNYEHRKILEEIQQKLNK